MTARKGIGWWPATLLVITIIYVATSVYILFIKEPEQVDTTRPCLEVEWRAVEAIERKLRPGVALNIEAVGMIETPANRRNFPELDIDYYLLSARLSSASPEETGIATWEYGIPEDGIGRFMCAMNDLAERVTVGRRCGMRTTLLLAAERCVP